MGIPIPKGLIPVMGIPIPKGLIPFMGIPQGLMPIPGKLDMEDIPGIEAPTLPDIESAALKEFHMLIMVSIMRTIIPIMSSEACAGGAGAAPPSTTRSNATRRLRRLIMFTIVCSSQPGFQNGIIAAILALFTHRPPHTRNHRDDAAAGTT